MTEARIPQLPRPRIRKSMLMIDNPLEEIKTYSQAALLGNDGELGRAEDLGLSDEESEEIQRRHFAKKKDPAAAQRAQKSLKSCLEAISAFREITGVRPVSLATPDDCERFQTQAQQRPWNWRKKYPKGKEANGRVLGPNTILKWSRELQAAFYEWFAKRMVEWAKAEERPHATHHAFRRTALQAARRGEDRIVDVLASRGRG